MAAKLSVKIYEDIKNDIETGKIDPHKFISEAGMAEKYGVSKAPVRDALHLLAEQGYLNSYHRKGYLVNIYTIDEINQLQALRKQIEKLSVELAIKNATDDEIASLKEPDENGKPVYKQNRVFHMRLAEISGNKYIPDVLDPLLIKITAAMSRTSLDPSVHEKLIDALASRNLEKALECLDRDIQFL